MFLFSDDLPRVECDVPNSKPVKIIVNKARIQIPRRVKEVGLLIFFTLLDKILNPKINKIKKGIPINRKPHKVSSQIGNTAS